jgi:hypothetical protein
MEISMMKDGQKFNLMEVKSWMFVLSHIQQYTMPGQTRCWYMGALLLEWLDSQS